MFTAYIHANSPEIPGGGLCIACACDYALLRDDGYNQHITNCIRRNNKHLPVTAHVSFSDFFPLLIMQFVQKRKKIRLEDLESSGSFLFHLTSTNVRSFDWKCNELPPRLILSSHGNLIKKRISDKTFTPIIHLGRFSRVDLRDRGRNVRYFDERLTRQRVMRK